MDTKDLIGGNNVTLDVVRTSQSRKAVILSGGAMKTFQDGKTKLSLLVEMDGKSLTYTPNKTSLKNISLAYGYESNNWVGKSITYETGIIQGKDAIIARPIVSAPLTSYVGVVQ